jgi:lactate permease
LFIIAFSPILWLVIALSFLKMPGHKACPLALVISLVAALFVEHMAPYDAFTATLEGLALACWPILLVIIAAIFTYNLSLYTKGMDTIKKMLTNVSTDRRILVLLIGWGFGGFLEGMAGFGTAVAIPASMLAGIGINPIIAASVCLIANSVPTAYGSIGIPLVTLGNVTAIDTQLLAKYTCIQLAPIALLCPFIMVIVTGKSLKALKGVGLISLIAGVAFLIPEFAVSFLIGPELAVIAGSIGAMGAIVAYAKAMPVNDPEYRMDVGSQETDAPVTAKQGIIAWLPFILIFFFLLLTSKLIPAIHDPLNLIKTSVLIYSGAEATPYTFTWVATPGILILLAAFIGGHVQQASFGEMFSVLGKTIINLRKTILTIITVIATAKVMGYSGMTHEIAQTAVNTTGTMYPFIAAFIGSIGTFITGSATSSCVLFGKLQTESAIAIHANAAWIAASNATGACAGKMISPQSIAIASAAIGMSGCDSDLLKFAVKVYVPFIILMGCLVYFGQIFVN